MKQILIIFLISFFSVNIYAQNFFQTEIGTDTTHSTGYNVIQNSNNEYIIAGYYSYTSPVTDSMGTYLIKLSETGKILQQKDSFLIDTSIAFRDIVLLENNHFLTYATLSPQNEDWNNYIALIEYDNNFNIIKNNKIKFPIDTVDMYKTHFTKFGDEVICYGGYRQDEHSTMNFIYKLNTDADSLAFKIYNLDVNVNNVKFYNSDIIYLTGSGFNDTFWSINKLNSDLTTDTIFDVYENLGIYLISNKTNLQFISDTSFVYFGVDNQNYADFNVTILDTAFNVINNVNRFGGDYQEFLAENNSLDVTDDAIFVSGGNFLHNILTVAKLDKELNVLWCKDFQPDYFYVLASIIATNDGGCLILTANTKNNTLNIYVLKIDANGCITHINGELIDKSFEFVVLPNPTSDILKIKKAVQVPKANFILYNTAGQIILQKTLFDDITEMSVSDLQQGVYLYNIFENGVLSDEGKVVVE